MKQALVKREQATDADHRWLQLLDVIDYKFVVAAITLQWTHSENTN